MAAVFSKVSNIELNQSPLGASGIWAPTLELIRRAAILDLFLLESQLAPDEAWESKAWSPHLGYMLSSLPSDSASAPLGGLRGSGLMVTGCE
jgi:hypothetical protein